MERQKREEKTEMSDQSVQKKMAKPFSFAGVQITFLRMMYASSLSAALGSASSSCLARMDSAVVPCRKCFPAGMEESFAFMVDPAAGQYVDLPVKDY